MRQSKVKQQRRQVMARRMMIEQLLDTLGPETDGVDETSFLAELRRRSDEIDQGKAELVPWSDLKNEPF